MVGVLFVAWWGWLAAFVAAQTHAGEQWLLALAVPVVLLSAWETSMVAHRRPALVGAALLASPIVVMPARDFVRAAQSYRDGSARLIRVGLPAGIPPFRLDPATRIPLHFSGCVTTDVWNARVWINNETVQWLSATLGPMPGLYEGPLPTDEELVAAIADGVSLRAAYDGAALTLDGETFALPRALALTLDGFLENDPDGSWWRAAVLHARLLVVREGRVDDDPHVFDLATGQYLGGGVAWDVAEAHPELAPRWQREMIAQRD
jgi:hypothetical protein